MTVKKTALVKGYIRAIADTSNPAQTRLQIILTDFEPNKNKQGVPRAEAANILRTAYNAPIKINFNGKGYAGHKGAFPIGSIAEAAMSTDNGRDVIEGVGVIWNDMYPDISDHLKKAFAEGIGTSWEIYYKNINTDENGVDWLEDCVFAGTAIVEVPAYGPNRTRVLAIAESMENIDMANETETEVTNTDVDVPAVASDEVQALRTDISSIMTTIQNMYSGLYEMMDETDEIEASLATTDMPSMAEQLTKLVASVSKRFTALQTKAASAETELTTLKDGIAQAELVRAEAERLETRKAELAKAGIDLTDEKKDFYVKMPDDMFKQYVTDMTAVMSRATAEQVTTVKVPEPKSSGTNSMSTKELAAAIVADLKQ